MAKKKKWREFEELIVKLHADLDPNADVKHDVRIRGVSGVLRQVDATITTRATLYPVLTILECKHYKNPVEIDLVEAFVTKLRDLKASHGVIVSNMGFTAGAQSVAAGFPWVTLISYREAREADWAELLGAASWLRLFQTEKHMSALNMRTADGYRGEVPLSARLVETDGTSRGSVSELLATVIEQSEVTEPVDEFKIELAPRTPLFLEWDGERHQVQEFTFTGSCTVREFTLNLRLASGHILQWEPDKKAVLSEFYSQSFEVEKMFRPELGRKLTAEEYRNHVQAAGQVMTFRNEENMRYLRFALRRRRNP